MRARAVLVAAAALLLLGSAWAQGGGAGDTGAMCRSFCDADAGKCRKDAAFDASVEADPLVDFRPRADKDRFKRSQQCSQARLACRQKCVAPAAAGDGASAPR